MNTLKIRTIIIDDEQEGRDVMQNLLKKIPEVQILAVADDADTGIDLVIRLKPDLIFLDIRMPRKSGLDMVRELSEKQVMTTVVFVTAYDEYAIQAIKVAAFDFLLKPVDPDELHRVIRRFQAEKLQEEFDRKIAILMEQFKRPEKIRLNTRTGFILIDPASVIYIQADGNYCEIIFSKTKKEVVTQQLGTLSELFPAGKFFRVSRSSLINLSFLRKVDRRSQSCELECGGESFIVHISKDMTGEIENVLR